MARYLKRWESPRKEGRNDRGRGGSARQRQLKKREQRLRKRLRQEGDSLPDDSASLGGASPPKPADQTKDQTNKRERIEEVLSLLI
jgi:hypothetical protein